jgi:hypothetical protein
MKPERLNAKLKNIFKEVLSMAAETGEEMMDDLFQEPEPDVAPLTDAECDAFRRHPGSFENMVRCIWECGHRGKRAP